MPPALRMAENKGHRGRYPGGADGLTGPIVDSNQLLTPYDCGDLNEPKLNKMLDCIFSVALTTSHVPRSHVK